MSKEMLKSWIELVSEDEPLPDEIEAILEAKKDIAEHGTIKHDEIKWD